MNKENFDVNNPTHVELYKSFFKSSSWGEQGCPFILEYPWLNIPDMIKHKIVKHFLGV